MSLANEGNMTPEKMAQNKEAQEKKKGSGYNGIFFLT